MFDLFGTKKFANEVYFVYRTEAARYRALFEDLQEVLSAEVNLDVVCFFKSNIENVKRLGEASGLHFVSGPMRSGDSAPLRFWMIDEYLMAAHPQSGKTLVVDCHPLRGPNEQLLEHVGKGQTVGFYLSLQHPIFQVDQVKNVSKLMERMGVMENERIAHTMVDKAIIKVQKRLEAKLQGKSQPAESIEAWSELNPIA